jgi:stringent starvation protein B
MTPSKPYLLRALYEWILDNDLTPHLIADAEATDIDVPPQAVQEGRVVLNISPSATRNLVMENDAVHFQARFGGVSREVWLSMSAILAIYARENGQGMMFADGDEPPSPEDDTRDKQSEGPKLRVIK